MGHNYAKPLTPAMRLERLFKRIPQDWAIMLTRAPRTGEWQARIHPPDQEGVVSDTHDNPADALQEGWRLNRRHQEN